jgi:hypothetical protein
MRTAKGEGQKGNRYVKRTTPPPPLPTIFMMICELQRLCKRQHMTRALINIEMRRTGRKAVTGGGRGWRGGVHGFKGGGHRLRGWAIYHTGVLSILTIRDMLKSLRAGLEALWELQRISRLSLTDKIRTKRTRLKAKASF